MLPRGIRNNNPLNIRRTAKDQWKGLRAKQTDASFCQYRLTPVFASLIVWNMVGGQPFICSRVPIITSIGCLPSGRLSASGRRPMRI